MNGISENKFVFINCPFDENYRQLFYLAAFTIFACGYTPRCAWELGDAAAQRVTGILGLIDQCRLSVHDLCRAKTGEDIRFNMPFELGLFVAARHFGGSEHEAKKAMVLHEKAYEYQRFLSDMAGSDFHAYDGRSDLYCKHIRDFLAKDCAADRALYGHKIIIEKMEAFEVRLASAADADGLDIENLQFVDYMHILTENDVFECAVKPGNRKN
ncbi:hypothetical protein F1654_08245 [Alkalicaulis satelles]|uniref:Uncharacterized protein n=1 Tax=Alkalicaulis satelles TaxID=2609175 RepID=A0A5M6ZGD8_9PROT|nr:hypothetical protein [Alkalicaulis satelles]KAA5803779.1 hypothetical protein F1654_08245 [Alkalicaulis satelles]